MIISIPERSGGVRTPSQGAVESPLRYITQAVLMLFQLLSLKGRVR